MERAKLRILCLWRWWEIQAYHARVVIVESDKVACALRNRYRYTLHMNVLFEEYQFCGNGSPSRLPDLSTNPSVKYYAYIL